MSVSSVESMIGEQPLIGFFCWLIVSNQFYDLADEFTASMRIVWYHLCPGANMSMAR